MARADWFYEPLRHGAIYEYGSALLQAWAVGETWRLFITNEDGRLPEPSQGLLFGYELAHDMTGWHKLHYITVPQLWPSYHVWYIGFVEIDPAELIWVAESVETFAPKQQVEAEAFRELMSEFEWELETGDRTWQK